MMDFKMHIFKGQSGELVQAVPKLDLIDGRFTERSDYYSELYLELKPDSESARKLADNDRVLLQLPNGDFREFVLYEPETDHNSKAVRMSASYVRLDKTKIIRPFSSSAQTNLMLLTDFLEGTDWNVGEVEFGGIHPYASEHYLGVYTSIRKMADFFGLQIRFRIEYVDEQIKRFVDMSFDFGEFKGVELTDSNGLINVSIKENTDVITSLICIAENNVGTKFEVTVTDMAARNQFGQYGSHLWDVFVINEKGLTPYQVQVLGEKELVKRSQKTIEISSDQVDMYSLKGAEYDRLDLLDFAHIISREHSPTLRIQARVVGINQSIVNPSDRKLTMGEYIKYE